VAGWKTLFVKLHFSINLIYLIIFLIQLWKLELVKKRQMGISFGCLMLALSVLSEEKNTFHSLVDPLETETRVVRFSRHRTTQLFLPKFYFAGTKVYDITVIDQKEQRLQLQTACAKKLEIEITRLETGPQTCGRLFQDF